ncbi:rho GTPase-activating protein gacD isoform X2 [Stomoxys calcitrans]|uniref:rho GTPase-activating protein gacD isoform X2 n=1 Tax=Stomoxys calcitrans TaxID=35570 RepID=UPI0027E24B46|nr:rho GTPase-activating protein gacD isoform X2 [Stomoxys calcitrans]
MDPNMYRSHSNLTKEPWFSYSTQQLAPARESEGILIATAATAANERRGGQQKSIMDCLRDRTPSSYTRSNSHIARANGGILPSNKQYIESISPQKEPRSRPIKLTLLKSSSTRDISRLFENQSTPTLLSQSPAFTSSTDLHKMTTSSSLSSASTNCSGSCLRHIQSLEKRIGDLETQLQQQNSTSQTMATQIEELNKKYEMLVNSRDAEGNKRKKSSSPKQTKKKTENSGGGGGASIALQPSKLVAWMKLSNFWKQRPSIQTLKEQNIYNDEPCFDTEIEMVLKDDVHKTVPKIVVDCCVLIEEKYRKSTEAIEGIYRQCGDYNKMQSIRFCIDANNYDALRQPNVDIHTLAGVLKLFLREIKSPLVSANEAKTFIGKPNQWLLTDLSNKQKILKKLICTLPEVNRDTMEYLFAHFNRLTKVPLQHISAETLAISITPSIFHTIQQGARMQDIHDLLKESEILADCVKIMIEYHQKIFDMLPSSSQNPTETIIVPIPFPRFHQINKN